MASTNRRQKKCSTVCKSCKAFAFFLLLTASTNRRQKNVLRFVEVVSSKKNENASTVSTNRNVYYFYGFYEP